MNVLKQLYLTSDYHDKFGMIFNTDCMDLMRGIEVEGVFDVTLTDIPYNAVSRSDNGLRKIEFGSEDDFDLTYKSYDELCEMFDKQGLDKEIYLEAIENTNRMADSVEDFELDKSFKYPVLYGDNDEQVLIDRLREKYLDKVNRGIIDKSKSKEYGNRVKEELEVFHKLGMSGFMLFMSEMMSWCWKNDIPSGACRGSVGGSLVAYLSDITDVDPMVWGTMFSRFCNEHRVEIGDIVELNHESKEGNVNV